MRYHILIAETKVRRCKKPSIGNEERKVLREIREERDATISLYAGTDSTLTRKNRNDILAILSN